MTKSFGNWINPRNLKPASLMSEAELRDTLDRWPPYNCGGALFWSNGKYAKSVYAKELSRRIWARLLPGEIT